MLQKNDHRPFAGTKAMLRARAKCRDEQGNPEKRPRFGVGGGHWDESGRRRSPPGKEIKMKVLSELNSRGGSCVGRNILANVGYRLGKTEELRERVCIFGLPALAAYLEAERRPEYDSAWRRWQKYQQKVTGHWCYIGGVVTLLRAVFQMKLSVFHVPKCDREKTRDFIASRAQSPNHT